MHKKEVFTYSNEPGILSQLLEKKDLFLYIEFRIKHLQNKLQLIHYRFIINNMVDIVSVPMSKSELKTLQNEKDSILSRIRELEKLKSVLSEGRLKKQSKIYWKEEHKIHLP